MLNKDENRNEEIRTHDPIVPNDMRYQTALHSDIMENIMEKVITNSKINYSVIFEKLNMLRDFFISLKKIEVFIMP